ncbi:hypothetical protein [Tenacibaculum ovolyticum]|uniref:hypothetical protein n=1 Tax=Tenacibaculum ovolyticum TaxID=104270 RepID=UPI0007EDA5B7|nr:hypothetical protein [Tenacibaculum ovolyticum]
MIKIYSTSGEEINVVKSSINITKENNAFSTDFSVFHSKYPFLIKEDIVAVRNFGNRHLATAGRNKEFEVLVQFGSETHKGFLIITDYLKGSRKCNIRFGSELLTIIKTSISSFFGNHYFGAEIPYSETINTPIDPNTFMDAVSVHALKKYPEVDFCFPAMSIPDFFKEDGILKPNTPLNFRELFGTDLQTNNLYKSDALNFYRSLDYMSLNPMPYLMALVEKPLKSIGWKLEGDFKNDSFNEKIIIVPKVHNNTLFQINTGYVMPIDNMTNGSKQHIVTHDKLEKGTFSVELNLKGINNAAGVSVTALVRRGSDSLYSETIDTEDFKGSFEFEVTEENKTENLVFLYSHQNSTTPNSGEFIIKGNSYAEKNAVLFHPTVDLKRYVPDWSFLDLLNNLKELRNLKIDIDEQRKVVSMNYNTKFLSNFDYVDLTGYIFKQKSLKNNTVGEYRISYADEPSNGKTGSIANVFKTNYSDKGDFDKDGVTLAIYDGGNEVIEFFEDKSLKLDESLGSLYNIAWRDWLFFLNNSSTIQAEAYLPQIVVEQLGKKHKIYYDTIQYAVTKIDYSLSSNELIKVQMTLRNILRNGAVSNTDFVVSNPEKEIILNSLTRNTFSYYLHYTLVNFTAFNGRMIAKQLTQNPDLGIEYTGKEYFEDNVSNPEKGTVSIFYLEANKTSWWELQATNFDGSVVSNKMYHHHIYVPYVNMQKIKLIHLDIVNGGVLGIRDFFKYRFEFDGIAPTELVFELAKSNLQGVVVSREYYTLTDLTKSHYIKTPASDGVYNLSCTAVIEGKIYTSTEITLWKGNVWNVPL